MDTDIISLDLQIQRMFQTEIKNVDVYREKVAEIKRILDQDGETLDEPFCKKLQQTVNDYEQLITSISSEETFNFYIIESVPLLEEYKRLLRTPLKMTFVGSCKTNDLEKDRLISQFMAVAKKYCGNLLLSLSSLPNYSSGFSLASSSLAVSSASSSLACSQANKIKIVCDNCKTKNVFLSEGIIFICIECGYEKEIFANTLSYKDMSRTNILQKYSYERRSHFRDCINQFQGKQNCKIDEDIYASLEDQFEKLHMLVGDKNSPKEIRYQNIEQDHVLLFLKELGYDKQYENAKYIYSVITGKKCPDISHIEEQLMIDFDLLVNLYIKKFKYEKKIDRKSFMNIQYVFFQLLSKNKYPCKKEDFNILKTIDRKAFHDDVFKLLFEELGWNHTPFF
jgi:hypothetical protein